MQNVFSKLTASSSANLSRRLTALSVRMATSVADQTGKAEQGFKELLTLQKGGGATKDFEAAQQQILSLVAEKPELKETAAAKLAAIASELASGKSESKGPLEASKLSSTSTSNAGSPIEKLKRGFLGFKFNYYLKEPALFEPLKTGQSPKVIMIACCDSRVAPDTVLDSSPGEVFVVRNIANIVPPMEESGELHGTSAALEYAVLHLKVEHIVVTGHRACGGIKALMTMTGDASKTPTGHKSYIGDWMNVAAPAKQQTLKACKSKDLETQLRFCEKASVDNSLSNLLTFPWIKEAVDAGRLQLHGWYYDFVDGALTSWTPDSEEEEITQ